MSSLDKTFGAILIGLLFATFFQGVLSVQAYVYYESFPNDSWRTKSLVAAVWCLDLLHLVLISQATYHYLITDWGNLGALLFSTWELNLHLAMVGLATIMCQCLFLHRHVDPVEINGNKNKALVAVLAFLCIATFGLDIAIAVHDIQHPAVTEFSAWVPEVIALFSVGAGTDVLMALLLCYYIRRGRSGFEKTNSIISQVLRYTITTGLVTSVLAVACLIAYFASPNTFIFIAMHFSLGRLYTNALLATLNSRRVLRAAADKRGIQRAPGLKPVSTSFGSGSGSPNSSPIYKTGPGNVSFKQIQLDTNLKGASAGSQPNSPEYLFKGACDHDIELQAVRDKV